VNQTITRPIALQVPLCKAVAFAGGLGLSMLSYSAHAAPTSSGHALGQSGRFTQLEPVICRSFVRKPVSVC